MRRPSMGSVPSRFAPAGSTLIAQGFAGILAWFAASVALLALLSRSPGLHWTWPCDAIPAAAASVVGLFWGFVRPVSWRKGLVVVGLVTASVVAAGRLLGWLWPEGTDLTAPLALALQALAAPLTSLLVPRRWTVDPATSPGPPAPAVLHRDHERGRETRSASRRLAFAARACTALGIILPVSALVIRHDPAVGLSVLGALAALAAVVLAVAAAGRAGPLPGSGAGVLVCALLALPLSWFLSLVAFMFRDYVQ